MKSIKFMYKNVANPNQTYETVSDFFENYNAGVVDTASLEIHIANDNKYQYSRESILLEDMKTVILTREFETEELANEWLVERAKLPSIDKNLSEEQMMF
mgnify:CR=1 FL=1